MRTEAWWASWQEQQQLGSAILGLLLQQLRKVTQLRLLQLAVSEAV